MAVQQLQIPSSNINNLVDQSTWAGLGNLGNVYQQAQQQAAQQRSLASLGADPAANAQALIQSGVPGLVSTGLNLQSQQQERAERLREYNERQAIAAAQERRAQAAFEENTPEARIEKIKAAGLNPADQASKIYIATGQNFPGTRAGLGQPTYTRDASGQLHMWQLSSTGEPVEVKFGEGQTPLAPGEMAGQKQEAVSMAKAKSLAATLLPKASDQVAINLQALDELAAHPGRENATGKWRGQLSDESPLLTQEGIDFRNKLNGVKSASFLSAFDTLRGAGAISDREGQAATAAVNRLSTVTSAKEFDQALDEVRRYYTLGRDRLRRAARGDFTEHPPDLRPGDFGTTAPAPAGNRPPLSDIYPPAR